VIVCEVDVSSDLGTFNWGVLSQSYSNIHKSTNVMLMI